MGSEKDAKLLSPPPPVDGPLERPMVYDDGGGIGGVYNEVTSPNTPSSETVLPKTEDYRKK